MRITTCTLTVGLCLGIVPGQSVTTLPSGLERTDGGKRLGLPFDANATCHYMEIHRPWPGARPRAATQVRFRRGIKGSNATARARSADLTFVMGHGDFNSFGRTFANNYRDSPTQVLPRTTLALPDWSQPKNPSQALSWDLTIPFKSPFTHNGTDAIVWEIYYQNGTAGTNTGYVVERVGSFLPYGVATGSVELAGCRATGQSGRMAHRVAFYNYGQTHAAHPMRVAFYAGNNPSLQNVQVAFGLQKLAAPVPGWCERIYTDPLGFFALGAAGLHGLDLAATFDLPYLASAVNVPIYTQAFAPDASLGGGIALSNGCVVAMPGVAYSNQRFQYLYAIPLAATTGSGPFTAGSVVTGY